MNSRFKFVQSVNPQSIPPNAVKPKFSKLTLATTKFIGIETVQKEPNKRISQTVTCMTTTTTTMTKVLNEPAIEIDTDEISCGQMPKILQYESTTDDINQSNILTDDDTNSAASSIDSKELEDDLKEASQPTQDTIPNIDQIDTQMQNLSFISPFDRVDGTAKRDESVHDMSRQFDQLDLDGEDDDDDVAEHDDDGENLNDDKATKSGKSVFSGSVQTLSSNDTVDQEPSQPKNLEEKNVSVIVVSDTDSEEDEIEEPVKRNISQEPPLKPTFPSSDDPAMYNISTIDSSTMQKVNNFFDNAPFVEPAVTIEHSFNSSHLSISEKEEIIVAETSDEESIGHSSVIDTSMPGKTGQQTEYKSKQRRINNDVEQNQAEFSDNNIVLDIPVIKSTSDQPRQLIRSQSGVRLKASHSSPIVKTATFDAEGLKRTSSNVIVRTPGSSIRVNSNNGQVSIAAKININIEIVEDSSEESSEDGKPARKSQAIQSSEECETGKNNNLNTNSNDEQSSDDERKSINLTNPVNSTSLRTPAKNCKLQAVKTPAKTPTKTPTTASKIKQFEFVPPKSMTKTKKIESNGMEPGAVSESGGNENGFKVDKNIPISPRDQELLHKVYGNAWKTPDVIRSYSAVKGKQVDRAAVNKTPSSLKDSRYSKGFDLFKQKLKTNLNSTRLEDHAEISIIEPSEQKNALKSPEKMPKPKTPRSKAKQSAKKIVEMDQSPSVLTKKKPSPKSNRKKITTPATDSSSTAPRPQRSVRKKKIVYSDDGSDKENESDWSDGSSYSDSCTGSGILTDDDSGKEDTKSKGSARKPKSVRGKKAATSSTTKRPAKKSNKDDLIYLDLSSEEIARVDENHHANVSEEDLANITRKFLEADLNDEEKPKKKVGRKLFTQNYDDIEEEPTESEPKSVKKKPIDDSILDVEIPRFRHKLFDSKKFGSPTLNKTPNTKGDINIDEFKTPNISRILAERKTPFDSAKSKLDTPPRMFTNYGFLKSLDVQASMMLCHPDAKKFRDNFKAHKDELTSVLYKLYNERVFDNKLNVDIIWNKKLTTTAGRFHGRSKSGKVSGKNHRIELSEKVLTSADRLRCTLIHELCHAATWIFDNERGHGARWKAWARKANQAFPELPIISVCHNYDIEYKYTYKCDMCHSKSYSHSKSKKVENIRCSYCHGMISIFLNKKKDGKTIMEPVREASGFAKFVKEKYKDFKKPGVKHAEVMRLISSQYSTLSQEEKMNY